MQQLSIQESQIELPWSDRPCEAASSEEVGGTNRRNHLQEGSYCELCGRTEERSGSREGTGELACSFSVWISVMLMALND